RSGESFDRWGTVGMRPNQQELSRVVVETGLQLKGLVAAREHPDHDSATESRGWQLPRRPAHGYRRYARIVDLATAHRDQLSKNSHGNFFGRNGADVEADGRVHALQ